jgi:hypothetical protein
MHLNHASAQTTTSTFPGVRALHFRAVETSPFNTVQHEARRDPLKQTYLECLKNIKSQAETLREAIVGLLGLGIPWQDLTAWAKAAGHTDRYSQKLVSQILLDLGIRRRGPGAGPKSPPEAFLIERDVHELYGEDALKFLGAACIVAKARKEGELEQSPTENEHLLIPIGDKNRND